eukprot:366175-Chlamydomonas_euryale.AAC.15
MHSELVAGGDDVLTITSKPLLDRPQAARRCAVLAPAHGIMHETRPDSGAQPFSKPHPKLAPYPPPPPDPES